MDAYCTRCHAATLRGEQRHGAPGLHDFDTLFGIKVVFDHIDETTAAGPAATNTGMPATPDQQARITQLEKRIDALETKIDLLIKLAPSVKGVLTAQQRRLLPSFITGYLDPHYLAAIRSGTQGSGFVFGLPGGIDVGSVVGGGGPGEIRIVRP